MIKKILVSQPKPSSDKSPYYDIMRKHGVEIVFHPFIKVQGLTPREFRDQHIDISQHTAVIFTSRHAIDHFFGLLFGVLKVATVASVILYTIQNIDTHEIILKKEIKENSLAFRYIEPIVPDAMKWHEDHAMESPAPETILPQ